MRPTVGLTTGSSKVQQNLMQSLAALRKSQVYVGIPATNAMERKRQMMGAAGRSSGKKRARLEKAAVESGVNNAELLYIHSNGSPLRHIPARPVIEPAITEPGNKALITKELGKAAEAGLAGNAADVTMRLNRAGMLAQNICRAWFVDPRNGWAPNAPSTIRRKGSDRPLIDTGALRQAITYIVVQE